MANAWIVNDPVDHADAIVVLGGGAEYRAVAAAQLYSNMVWTQTSDLRRPMSAFSNGNFNFPVVLLAQPQLNPAEEMGLRQSEYTVARNLLMKLGVPPEAIQPLGTNVTSTRDEAAALAAWAAVRPTSDIRRPLSVVIPTDIFHTRRAKWIFEKALIAKAESGKQKVEIHLEALDTLRYSRTNWWTHEEGLIAFQNEVVKSIYYHLRY